MVFNCSSTFQMRFLGVGREKEEGTEWERVLVEMLLYTCVLMSVCRCGCVDVFLVCIEKSIV